MALKTFAHIGGGRDLTIEEQGQFYDTMKSSIWVLKVGKGSDERVASGLCISNKGYILTTSCVVGKTNDTIFGREVNSNSFQQLKIIKRGDSMLILEPMKMKKEGYDYAAISDDSVQVSECQEVYCIDHIGSGVYSFVVGEVSHRRRVIDDIVHLQVANIHTTGHSDIVFSSTGHLMGIVMRKLSNKGNRKDPDVDVGHNLVLHFSEINKFLKTFRPRASKSVK